jgi:hypothetical protein
VAICPLQQQTGVIIYENGKKENEDVYRNKHHIEVATGQKKEPNP